MQEAVLGNRLRLSIVVFWMHTHLKKLNTNDRARVVGGVWTRESREIERIWCNFTSLSYKSNSLKKLNLDNLKCLLFVSTCASTTNTFSHLSAHKKSSINLLETEHVVTSYLTNRPLHSTSREELFPIRRKNTVK